MLNLTLWTSEQLNISGAKHASVLPQCCMAMFLCLKKNKCISSSLPKVVPNNENSFITFEYWCILLKKFNLHKGKNRKKKCKIYHYIVITHTRKWDYMYQMSIIHSWTLTTSLSFELNGSPLILMITSALFDTKLAAIWVTSTGPICINKSVNGNKQNKEIGEI